MLSRSFVGVGLHSGKLCRCTVKTSRTFQDGVVFKLLDHKGVCLPANWKKVHSTNHATTLSSQGASVSTVEHLLAALQMLRMHNVVIEVEGPEIPILDGSSMEFIRGLRDSNMANQPDVPRRILRVLRPVHVQHENGAHARLLPPRQTPQRQQLQQQLQLTVDVDFTHRGLRRCVVSANMYDDDFIERVASARTFTFKEDYDQLVKAGLAGGGSMDNAVLYDDGLPINQGGLRVEHEHAWHKLLDCVGDLSLVGMSIDGHYHAKKPGHGLNVKMVEELMSQDANFHIE
jgi:UDP-3-O-[3-hydroxymyristoyl] N-acetylglucosamine deacetylase